MKPGEITGRAQVIGETLITCTLIPGPHNRIFLTAVTNHTRVLDVKIRLTKQENSVSMNHV